MGDGRRRIRVAREEGLALGEVTCIARSRDAVLPTDIAVRQHHVGALLAVGGNLPARDVVGAGDRTVADIGVVADLRDVGGRGGFCRRLGGGFRWRLETGRGLGALRIVILEQRLDLRFLLRIGLDQIDARLMQ
jgi:hypothetical protein